MRLQNIKNNELLILRSSVGHDILTRSPHPPPTRSKERCCRYASRSSPSLFTNFFFVVRFSFVRFLNRALQISVAKMQFVVGMNEKHETVFTKVSVYFSILDTQVLDGLYEKLVEHRGIKALQIFWANALNEDFVEFMKKVPSTSLTEMLFLNGTLPERAIHALATVIKGSSLNKLDFKSIEIDTKCAMIALANVVRNGGIEYLRLGHNRIGLGGVTHLARVLSEGTCALKILKLKDNYICDAGVAALAKALPNTRIEELKLNMNEITEVGVAEICKAVKSTPTIVKLALDHNCLRDTSATIIAELIRSHPMKEMSLKSNSFTDKGVVHFANAIAESITLEHLYLRKNVRITSGSVDVGSSMTSLVSSPELTPTRHKL